MKVLQKTVFVTSDGAEFENQEDATKHETLLEVKKLIDEYVETLPGRRKAFTKNVLTQFFEAYIDRFVPPEEDA